MHLAVRSPNSPIRQKSFPLAMPHGRLMVAKLHLQVTYRATTRSMCLELANNSRIGEILNAALTHLGCSFNYLALCISFSGSAKSSCTIPTQLAFPGENRVRYPTGRHG